MNPKVRTMLEQMYEQIDERLRDSRKTWNCLTEFLAACSAPWLYRDLHSRLGWLFEDQSIPASLTQIYDSELLASDYHDHLGQMYLEKIVSKSEAQKWGQFLTPESVADMMAQMTIPETDKPINILDPAVGSGRLLMAAHSLAPKARLFGVDNDLQMVRLCLTNFAIHNIPGYVLHANSLDHQIDISTEDGRFNWQYANRWNSHIDKLKTSCQPLNYTLPLSSGQKRKPGE